MKHFRLEGMIGYMISAASLQRFLDDADGDDVSVTVNSPGGVIPEGFSMMNSLREYVGSGGKLSMRVDYAASMASVIAMTPGAYVTMWKNSSMMMIHRAWGVAVGNADQLEQSGYNLRKVEEISISNYMERAGDNLDEDELRDMLEKETVLNADEAKKYGLIDRVLRDKGNKPKQMQLVQGLSVDFEKFAAKIRNTELANDIEYSESLRDVESALRDVGHFTQTDAKMLISRIRNLGRRDVGSTRHRDGDHSNDQQIDEQFATDFTAMCDRIASI